MSTQIHSTAVVSPQAEIGADCEIGPYCVVGPHVKLGAGCQLHSHVVLDGHTTIGPRCVFFPLACIGLKSQDLKWKGGTCRLEIGADNVFREHVTVHTATNDGDATKIGDNNLFLVSSHVAHDCIIGNRVIISGFAALAGHIIVEDQAIISGMSGVHQFCRIGTMAIVGAGTKITQDVAPYMLIEGFPAEVRGVNKIGMERNGVPAEVQRAMRDVFKIVYRSGLTVSNALDKVRAEVPPSKEIEHFIAFCRASERGIAR